MKYTITLQWSDEDKCFVVFLPEFTNINQPCTHGKTYSEALQNAKELIEILVELAIEKNEPLPRYQPFYYSKISK